MSLRITFKVLSERIFFPAHSELHGTLSFWNDEKKEEGEQECFVIIKTNETRFSPGVGYLSLPACLEDSHIYGTAVDLCRIYFDAKAGKPAYVWIVSSGEIA